MDCCALESLEINSKLHGSDNEGKFMKQQEQTQVKKENSLEKEQLQQHKQCLTDNLSVYAWLLTNYYFSNKCDIIIDHNKFDQNNKVLLLNKASNINNKTNDYSNGSILTVTNDNIENLSHINKLEQDIKEETKFLLPSLYRNDKNENVIPKAEYRRDNNNIICNESIDKINLSNQKQHSQYKFYLNYTNSLKFLFILLILSQQQNAFSCYRSGRFERNDNHGFTNYHYVSVYY